MITERQQVSKKYWNEDICAYVYDVPVEEQEDGHVERRIWFHGTGATGCWIIQWVDANGDQIGDAEYAANKSTLRD